MSHNIYLYCPKCGHGLSLSVTYKAIAIDSVKIGNGIGSYFLEKDHIYKKVFYKKSDNGLFSLSCPECDFIISDTDECRFVEGLVVDLVFEQIDINQSLLDAACGKRPMTQDESAESWTFTVTDTGDTR